VMGEALLSRLLQSQVYRPEDVVVSDPAEARRLYLHNSYGVRVTDQNADCAAADLLLLAVKPQVFGVVTAGLVGRSPDHQLVLSILAGVTLGQLEGAFPGQPVVRVMPNTPATVGAGCTAIALGRACLPNHGAIARRIFEAVGSVVEVPEGLMDAVTGLSGSGPAYVALMVEALADGGVAAGLPRAIAQELALGTVLGTARLLRESGMHPALLKDQVTSPGGTTIAGVGVLEAAGFRSGLIEAVKAAAARSKELGQG
jgi:pyrroline-5-carboxylate reductase